MKNKYLKGIISLISSLCMITALIPVSVSAADSPASGWTVQALGGFEADLDIDESTSYHGSQSVKIHSETPGKANCYITFSTTVPVKKGRTYRFSFARKGEKILGSSNYCIDWGKRYVFSDMHGQSFDWITKSFLWTNTQGDRNATVRIIIDGLAEGIWLDNFEFVEWDGEIIGKNLISNPSFENDKATIFASADDSAASSTTTNAVDAVGAEAVFNALQRVGTTFDIEKYEEAMSLFSVLPLYKKNNIVIDGDGSDWADIYSVHVPVKKSQYQIYNNAAELNLEMDYKAAYDDENFYLYVETRDDIFAPNVASSYWANDSLQVAMSSISESFGDEVGLQYTEDGGYYTSNSWRFDEIKKMKIKTLYDGTKAVYEVAIPWSVHFGERPEDSFVFSILANDNDGNGREYGVELRPGIAEGKTNTQFISYSLMQDGEDFYSTMEKSGNAYSVFVVNTSEETKTYKISSDVISINEEITLEPGKGARVQSEPVSLKMGKNTIVISVSDGNVTRNLTKIADIAPNDERMNSIYTYYGEKVKELERLVKICRMLGISTDYEESRIWVINQFIDYLEEDYESEYFYPIAFANENLEDIYQETKANLEAYIAKEKTSREVPVFKTGEIEIDGESMIADVKVGNSFERRPTYFIGYGHFFEVQRDFPVFENINATAHGIELGASGTVPYFAEEAENLLSGWINYGLSSLETLKTDQVETEGSNGKAFYIHNETPLGPNKYAYWYQLVEGLRRGETYVLKFRAKAKDAKNCNIAINNVGGTRISLDGTYDWKDFEYEIKLADNQTRLPVGFMCENLTDELWLDDMSLTRKGEDRNFLKNGGFEYEYKIVGKYAIETSQVKRLGEILDELAKYNQTLDLLISPHYFPTNLVEPEAKTTAGGFFKMDITHPGVREILKLHITELIGPYKDHPALKTIVMTNEPALNSMTAGDVYLPDYKEWLRKKYIGDIARLNTNHKTSYASFEEVVWPEDFTEGYYDYVKFNNEIYNEFHQFLADCVKEVAPDVPVTAKPMDYNAYSEAGSKRGYHSYGTDMTLFKNWMDVNGCDSWAYYSSTTNNTMQTKMQWYDFMRSVKKAPSANSEDHIISDGNLDFVPQQAKWVETDLWQGALHGRVITNIWLWDSDYVNTPAGGSIRFRPDCIVAASDVSMDLNRLAYEATAIQTKKSDAGVLYSIASRNYNYAWMNAVHRAWEALAYNGMKVEYITEDQLDKMFEFPMLIVPQNYNVPEETAKKVLEYAKNGGKVIMIGEDCLKLNEYNQPISCYEEIKALSQIVPVENNNELMISPSLDELTKLVGDELEKLGKKRVKLINIETNKEAEKVDFSYVDYNGKLLINLCQYDWGNEGDYRIEVDGKPVLKIKDLRAAENVEGGIIHIEEYKPLLLELEV